MTQSPDQPDEAGNHPTQPPEWMPPDAAPPPAGQPPAGQPQFPQQPAPAVPQGWPAGYPAPGTPVELEADRYSVGTVIGWAVVTGILMAPVMLVAQFAGLALGSWLQSATGAGVGVPVTLLAALGVGLIPIIVAVMMLRRRPAKADRSPWLGVLIGSALFLLVFGGGCVALVGSMGGV